MNGIKIRTLPQKTRALNPQCEKSFTVCAIHSHALDKLPPGVAVFQTDCLARVPAIRCSEIRQSLPTPRAVERSAHETNFRFCLRRWDFRFSPHPLRKCFFAKFITGLQHHNPGG